MSATLMNTTLSYRLSVTNNGAEPLRDVIVAGDMIAAHASRKAEELLGTNGAALPELHRIAALAPGESVVLGGDIRLPLVSITPIRSGNAALFVPLARLRARGLGADGATVEGAGTFLVGQTRGGRERPSSSRSGSIWARATIRSSASSSFPPPEAHRYWRVSSGVA